MSTSISLYPRGPELELIDSARGTVGRARFMKTMLIQLLGELHGQELFDPDLLRPPQRTRSGLSGWSITFRLQDEHHALLRQTVGPDATLNGWVLVHLCERLRALQSEQGGEPAAPVALPARSLGRSPWQVSSKTRRGGRE